VEYEHEKLEGFGLAIIQGCQGRVWRWMLESMNNVGHARQDVVNGRCCWHWNFAGEPHQGISDALGFGVIGPNGVATIRVHGRTKIPAVDAMGCPRASDSGFFMDDDTGARRGNRGAVEIEGTMELGPCG